MEFRGISANFFEINNNTQLFLLKNQIQIIKKTGVGHGSHPDGFNKAI
jgi:hypothetical protein